LFPTHFLIYAFIGETNMRCNLIHGLGLSISVLLIGAGLPCLTSAQTVATTSAKTAHSALIKELRQAHELLAHADHDYDGHRAKAAEEVHKALVDLGYHHHKKAASPTTVVNGTVAPSSGKAAVHTSQPKMHEPQRASDAQLRQALQILQGSLTTLHSGKHPKAAANVNAAIAQINTALSLK
jgi:hypothetical protein